MTGRKEGGGDRVWIKLTYEQHTKLIDLVEESRFCISDLCGSSHYIRITIYTTRREIAQKANRKRKSLSLSSDSLAICPQENRVYKNTERLEYCSDFSQAKSRTWKADLGFLPPTLGLLSCPLFEYPHGGCTHGCSQLLISYKGGWGWLWWWGSTFPKFGNAKLYDQHMCTRMGTPGLL